MYVQIYLYLCVMNICACYESLCEYAYIYIVHVFFWSLAVVNALVHPVWPCQTALHICAYILHIIYSFEVSRCACLNEQQCLAVVNALVFPVWLPKSALFVYTSNIVFHVFNVFYLYIKVLYLYIY